MSHPDEVVTALPDVTSTPSTSHSNNVFASEELEETWELTMTWNGKKFELVLQGDDRLDDLKAIIYSLISVPPERQKIIGFVKGKPAGDEVLIKDLNLPKKHKFTVIGTSEENTFKDPSVSGLSEVIDDFDVNYYEKQASGSGTAGTAIVKPSHDKRNLRKIREKIAQCKIDIMNEPRPGKKLLVLDLDYSELKEGRLIVDTKPLLDGSLPPSECCRPGLHEFLEAVYPYYDIAVWSQTHWRWLESKLIEMGMIGDPMRTYKISFVADRTSMFPIFGTKNGQPYKHEVKPLAFMWAKFPQWSNKNTVHIDDLSRNFALNPGEGLKIRAFKTAGDPAAPADNQLLKLGRYLTWLASNDDFTEINHDDWKKFRTT